MKKDKTEDMPQLKSVQGMCRFCGQYMALEVPESFNDVDIAEEATKKCKCTEAQEYTRSKERTANGEAAVKTLFANTEGLDVMKKKMLDTVKELCKYELDSITLKKGGYTCKMKPSKDGVKISLEQKTVNALES
ncbi:MAG: hypothetical protein K6F73_07525 [Lachnospiraceae bacterium]|nr:hypothetical protein [Lachnospiraceae bacterium]